MSSDDSGSLYEAREAYRKANYKAICRMLRRVTPPRHAKTHHLDPLTYSKLPISITRLPFDSDEIDFDLRFSKPIDEAKFECIFANIFGAQAEGFNIPTHGDQVEVDTNHTDTTWGQALQLGVYSKKWYPRTGITRPHLQDYGPWRDPEKPYFGRDRYMISEHGQYCDWSVRYVNVVTPIEPESHESSCTKAPHVACLLEHVVRMNEALPRGELIVILTLLKQRLRRRVWNSHAIIPVLLYSVSRVEARVTQAHFDGKTLHLRQTDPVLLHRESLPKYKAMLRWMMAEPIGDTLFHQSRSSVQQKDLDQMLGPPSAPKQVAVDKNPKRDLVLLQNNQDSLIYG